MIKAGQMKRRADEELIPFFFLIKHLLVRLDAAEGHSSQLKQGIKKKNKKKNSSVYHTILFLSFFLNSSTFSTCTATAAAINLTSSVCRCGAKV